MNIDQALVKGVGKAYQKLELPFSGHPNASELSDVVKQHALLGAAAGMIPIPGADLASLVANTWAMYARLNKAIGVSFSDNALKSIASGVLANLASLIPGVALGVAAGTLLKLIPGVGTLGGMAVAAAAQGAVTYVAAKVYLKSLEVLVSSGKPLTEENIKMAATQTSKDKTFVKDAYAEGKEFAKKRAA